MKITRAAIRVVPLMAMCICVSVPAQSLEQKLEDKLASEWVKNAAWTADFDKAKSEARKSGKQIFAYFTRSYAP